jgi:hypothetical protein
MSLVVKEGASACVVDYNKELRSALPCQQTPLGKKYIARIERSANKKASLDEQAANALKGLAPFVVLPVEGCQQRIKASELPAAVQEVCKLSDNELVDVELQPHAGRETLYEFCIRMCTGSDEDFKKCLQALYAGTVLLQKLCTREQMIFHNDSHLNNFVVSFVKPDRKLMVRMIDVDHVTLGFPDTSVNISSANDTPENGSKGCYFDSFTYASSTHTTVMTMQNALLTKRGAENRLRVLVHIMDEFNKLSVPLYGDNISAFQHLQGKVKSKVSALQIGSLLKQAFLEFAFSHEFEKAWGDFKAGVFGLEGGSTTGVAKRLPF